MNFYAVLLAGIGIKDGQLVVEPELSVLAGLAQHLAWPITAILIVLILKKNLLDYAKGAMALKTFVEDGTKLATVFTQMKDIAAQVEKMQKGIQNIEEQDGGNISKEVEQRLSQSHTVAPVLNVDLSAPIEVKWKKLSDSWLDIKELLRRKAQFAGIAGNFQSIDNVSKMVEGLKDPSVSRPLSQDDAELIMTLHKQYSWMTHTTVPKDRFLTDTVYKDFLVGAETFRKAIA